MLFKLGLKNLRRNLLMNILVILQMTVVFIILISMISTILSRFRYYEPIKETAQNKGKYLLTSITINPENKHPLETSDELYHQLEGVKDITATFTVWLSYENEPQHTLSYDDMFIEKYTPQLENGHWFDLSENHDDVLQVVASENDYNIKTGDIITFTWFSLELKAEVIGMLKNGTKIIDIPDKMQSDIDCRCMYRTFDYNYDEKPLFIFRQKDLNDKDIVTQMNGPVLVTYNDDIGDDSINNNMDIFRKMNILSSADLSDLKENSLAYIFSQLYELMPIFICVFLLTLVGAISTSALSAKRQLRNYAVFYICGLKWRQCSLVNLFSSLICVTVSFILSLGVTVIAIKTGFLGNTVIETGIWQIAGCAVIGLIYVMLSMVLPLSIIGRNTPNQVLRAN